MTFAWIQIFVYFLILVAYILQYLDEGMAACSSILAWRIPMDRGAWRAAVHGVTKSRTRLSDQAQSTARSPAAP